MYLQMREERAKVLQKQKLSETLTAGQAMHHGRERPKEKDYQFGSYNLLVALELAWARGDIFFAFDYKGAT